MNVISILDLWMPIVVAAVLVFVVSSIVHMVLTYHRSSYLKLPRESETMADLRKAGLSPGMYVFPHAPSPKEMGSPEIAEKFKQGPVGFLTVRPTGLPAMGSFFVMWFSFCLLIGIVVAYLAGRTLAPGAEYLAVFRFTGTAAFLAYGIGGLVDSIWKGVPWSATLKHTFDGLLYALVTGGAFGWLWPGR